MSDLSNADAGWAEGFIADALKHLKWWNGDEPTEEPSRTLWHAAWNNGVLSMPYQIRRAYKEDQGREAPLALVAHIREAAQAFLTNPYPGETVQGRLGNFIRLGVDTPEKYAAHVAKAKAPEST